MHLIVGLGNPGKKYENTRHNAGFLAVDHFMEGREKISCQHKFQGELCELQFIAKEIQGQNIKVLFLKPQTYMNNSGVAVAEAVRFYKIDIEKELLIIHDELDLKFGYIKPAFDSGPAGHNGIKSIIENLGTQKFHRLRIGVESRLSRNERPTEDYVLENFNATEIENLKNSVFPKTDEYIARFLLNTGTKSVQ